MSETRPLRRRGARSGWLAAWVVASGCAAHVPRIPGPLDHLGRAPPPLAAPAEAPAATIVDRRVEPFAREVADAARHYLDHAPKGFRDDCSGFVLAVLDRAGLELEGNTASLYAWALEQGMVHHHKLPRPGDLAFFDDTYDRNDNGKLDDDLSHIAVVMEVHPDGTILLAQAGTSRGRTTLTMNLREPDRHEGASGEVVNDWLRVKRDSDPSRTEYLAGELWRAFATIDPQEVAAAEPAREPSARRVP